MHPLWTGYLFASFVSLPCMSDANQNDWFKISKEGESQILPQRVETDEIKEVLLKQQEEAMKEMEKFKNRQGRKREKDSLDKEKIEKSQFDKEVDPNGEEFDQLHKQLVEELQKEKRKQEQKETHKIKDKMIRPKDSNRNTILEGQASSGRCSNCAFEDWTALFNHQVLVFMSFSVPDQAWISLSNELEKVGGVFILRGLPDQSFQGLASRILHLKEQGVKVPIQLDPNRFLTYKIDQVPAIVIAEEQYFDKVLGHVSLAFALEKMAKVGETKIAKALYQLLKDES